MEYESETSKYESLMSKARDLEWTFKQHRHCKCGEVMEWKFSKVRGRVRRVYTCPVCEWILAGSKWLKI